MRVDVDKIFADIERERFERSLVEYKPMLFDQVREDRLLAALIADRLVLEHCEDVEVDDFWDMRNRQAFGVVRNLQAAHGDLTYEQIVAKLSELEAPDTLCHVAMCVARCAPFLGERCIDETARHLRRLAENRRSL